MIRRCLVLAAVALTSGCFDSPAPEPLVHVSVRGIGNSMAPTFAVGGVEVALFFQRSSFDGGLADGGRDQGPEVRRVVTWDRTDPFAFDVEVPAGPYRGVRLEVTGPLESCPHGIATVTIATGTDTTARTIGPEGASVSLDANASTIMCPP